MERYWYLSLVKGARGAMFGSSKVKDEMRGGERVLYALALIEIFSSLLSGRAGVSVVPNGVIKIINLRRVLICCAYHGIFIRYNHHSVMKLLITSDKHCEGRRTAWKCPIIPSAYARRNFSCTGTFLISFQSSDNLSLTQRTIFQFKVWGRTPPERSNRNILILRSRDASGRFHCVASPGTEHSRPSFTFLHLQDWSSKSPDREDAVQLWAVPPGSASLFLVKAKVALTSCFTLIFSPNWCRSPRVASPIMCVPKWVQVKFNLRRQLGCN